MLGNNRPDEIASGNEFTLGFPVLLILRIPVRNPGRVPRAHEKLSFQNDARSSRAAVDQKKGRPQRRSKASFRAAALPVRSMTLTRVPSTLTVRVWHAHYKLCANFRLEINSA